MSLAKLMINITHIGIQKVNKTYNDEIEKFDIGFIKTFVDKRSINN